jgi:hypothetical protein
MNRTRGYYLVLSRAFRLMVGRSLSRTAAQVPASGAKLGMDGVVRPNGSIRRRTLRPNCGLSGEWRTHMRADRNAPIVTAVMLILSSVVKASDCQFPTLAHEHRDVATIQALELEWTRAYLRGDTDFEACLLTPDFTEIMRNGEIKDLSARAGGQE